MLVLRIFLKFNKNNSVRNWFHVFPSAINGDSYERFNENSKGEVLHLYAVLGWILQGRSLEDMMLQLFVQVTGSDGFLPNLFKFFFEY